MRCDGLSLRIVHHLSHWDLVNHEFFDNEVWHHHMGLLGGDGSELWSHLEEHEKS